MAASRWIAAACMRSACAPVGVLRATCSSEASIQGSVAVCPSGQIGGDVGSSERLSLCRVSWQYQAGQREVDPDSLLRFAR